MRKILEMILLLTLCALLAGGCGKCRTEASAEAETVKESTASEETLEPKTRIEKEIAPQVEVRSECETLEPEESIEPQDNDIQPLQTEREREKIETLEPERQRETTQELEKTVPEAEAQPEIEETALEEPKPEQEKAEAASYSPQKVVELAVEKIKAEGKIYIPDDLDQMLAAGEISQEEYNACYPADGAGYLEYYVAADMNEARDISGTVQFHSEEDIAANIAGIYAVLPQQYFYIEYRGTVMYGDKECHVFCCYRA